MKQNIKSSRHKKTVPKETPDFFDACDALLRLKNSSEIAFEAYCRECGISTEEGLDYLALAKKWRRGKS